MELDENSLYRLIFRAVKQLNAENSIGRRESMYVVLPDCRKDGYDAFFQTISGEFQVFTIVSDAAAAGEPFQKLRRTGVCGTVIGRDQIDFDKLRPGVSVFPVVPRDLMVKTALCISDTFETKWIRSCIEKGWKVLFWKQGMEPLSGREPKAYRNRIQSYLRILSEYGIEIRDSLSSDGCAENPHSSGLPAGKKHAKVITAGEIGRYAENGEIVLEEGDLITALAEEKAMELGIVLVRK